MCHEHRPSMFLNRNNPITSFIASTIENGMKYIDLTQNERHWEVINSPTYGHHLISLADIFGLNKFAPSRFIVLCEISSPKMTYCRNKSFVRTIFPKRLNQTDHVRKT